MNKYHVVGKGARPDEQDPDIHDCQFLWVENTLREARRENTIIIYRDIANKAWNMRIGLEFFTVNYCPYCGLPVLEDQCL